MNATCKRLLSWLVVVTMVLSMVPVLDLSNFAVTTQAAENPKKDTLTAIEALRDDFAGKTATVSAICPVCGGEEAVEWTPLTGATAQLANPNGHYYLSGDVTFTAAGTNFTANNNTLCLNLNGNDITAGGIALAISFGNTINVMDSAEKDGTVTGTAANFQGGAINVGNANAKFNIYGGTFKKTGATGSVVCVRNNGGTVNMYGGTIDASEASSNACATTINVMGGANVTTFNLYDGLVKCGTMTAGVYNARGNIMLGYGGAANATFSMYGGTVVGGSYTGTADACGGTFGVVFGNTLNISGGTIYGGTSTLPGGNIYSIKNGPGNVNISGGTIVGEIYTRNAVNVTLSGEPQIVTSLELENGETVTATRGFDVSDAKTIDATGLTGGEIQVSGVALNAVLPVNCTDAAATAAWFKHADPTLDVGANDANQLVVIEYVEPEEPVDEPQVGVFAPDKCGGMAYCDACIAAGLSEEEALVEWTPISGTGLAAINSVGAGNTGRNYYHYYLSDDASFSGSAFTFTTNGATTCVNLNGKALTAGNRAIVLNYGSTINIMDTTGGSITGKYTGQNGAAIYVANPSGIVNIYGGTFKRSADSHVSSSVVRVQGYGGTINMYDGVIDATTVTGNTAQPGVYMVADENRTAVFNMYGGEIIGATTTSDGGAVFVTGVTTVNDVQKFAKKVAFNLYDGTISGGSGRAGGNIMVYTGELNISGGTISGGKSTLSSSTAFVTGGNIALRDGASLHMEGGVVCNGEARVNGGNIAVWSSVNTVEIVGGKIYGGVAGTSGANIYNNGTAGSALTIGGTAEVAGDIVTNQNTTNTLSGTPKIKTSGLYAADGTTAVTGTQGYEVKSNTNLNVSGLTGGEIEVTAANKGIVFAVACENAATVAEYFSSTTEGTTVAANADNQLYIAEVVDPTVPVVGVFNPEGCYGYAYCPVCGGDEPVEWTEIKGTGLAALSNPEGHYYLSDDAGFTTNVFSYNNNGFQLCLHLNGKTLTAGGVAISISRGVTVNIMGEGTVSGTAASNGATINVNNKNGVVNIHGGTFKNVEGATGAVIGIGANGGTVNMRGGVIDAEGVTSSAWATAVSIMGDKADADLPGVFNMYDGEIKCGTTSTNRGNIMVGYDTARANGATFNMMGGTVYGGANTANSYGTFLVQYGGTLNVTGGTIYGGTAEGAGANIFLSGNATYTATLNASGGEICGDVYTNQYATVNLSGAAKIVKEMTVGEETVTAESTGLYVYEGVLVNIDGLTAEAEVYIAGKLDATLTTGTGVTSGIKAYEASQYTEAVEGVVYLRLNAVAVVTAEGKTFYKTVDEAIANVGTGYIELHAEGLTVTISGDTYIDNRGYTVTVEGEGKLYAMDAANDDYNGYGSWTVNGPEVATDVINPVNGNRYIVIKNAETGAYSAHRVELYLTHASLRTSAAGLYYKAQYKCDATLADRVMAYGIVFSATRGEVHQGNFDADNDVYSIMEGFKANMVDNTVNGTSTEVFGIFKSEGRTNAENVAAGEAKVHATPYINVDCDGDGVSNADPYVIGNVQNDVYDANKAGVTYAAMSLYDVLKAINDNWAAYAEVQGQVQGFYNTWADKGMSEWATDLANISGANA